jgi:hypothetical protein
VQFKVDDPSEERYGSQWPPQAMDDPALDDEFHIIHRG